MANSDQRKRRQDIKRQLREKERAELLALLPFPVQELRGLIEMLGRQHQESSDQFDDSCKLTIAWLEAHGHTPEACMDFFRAVGGYCDFEIMTNVPSDHLLADYFE